MKEDIFIINNLNIFEKEKKHASVTSSMFCICIIFILNYFTFEFLIDLDLIDKIMYFITSYF